MSPGAMFTCARCGGTFEKGCTDVEAEAEAYAMFGAKIDLADYLPVCGECFELLYPDAR